MKRNSEKTNQKNALAGRGHPDEDSVKSVKKDEVADEMESALEDARCLRPLVLLEHLNESRHPQTLAQLANLMRVPKSTLMRLLRAMEAHGYVLHLPAERGFMAGPRTTVLAMQTLRGSTLRNECLSILRTLVRKLGETCNLTVPDAGRVLYVERVETSEPLRMHLQPGSRVPMHCTASGKLFLSRMSLLERQRLLAHMPLTRHSQRTITDRHTLEAELLRMEKQGYGVDNEEFVRGMIAVAVPVPGKSGQPVSAIACHGPTARLSLEDLRSHVPHLREAAAAISEVLFAIPQAAS